MSTETVYNKSTLLEMLHKRVVNVKFRKLNGDIRVMRCTLNANLLPPVKNTGGVQEEAEPNPNLVTVFDLDAADWRSFRLDRILEVL